MVFRFRMLSDENDHFVRDYEVMYDTTLLAFHQFILQSLEYEECMASFFTADERWEKLREFTLMEMGDSTEEGSPETMENVTLGQIIHHHRDRLIYLFDLFGDRAYYLEFVVKNAKNHGFPAFFWDNNVVGSDGENFGLLNRETLEPYSQVAVDGIMRGAAAGVYPY